MTNFIASASSVPVLRGLWREYGSSMTYARPIVYQDEPLRALQGFVDDYFRGGGLRSALDAGCGYTLPLDFSRDVHLVGLDASPEALAKNENIDQGIVGDIETYPLEADAYDLILCWTVLEHLTRPGGAIANMAHGLRPGGLLVIGIPNIWSLKGLLTKFTPHRFHVWVYRRFLGWENAGKPGFGPYPTYLRREIASDRLERFSRTLELERVYAKTYEIELGLPKPVAVVWTIATTLLRIVTLGRWNAAASDHVAVFKKSSAGSGA